jgi:xylulose-5-phosphate/fructose-6-phosphate phosphoketolase
MDAAILHCTRGAGIWDWASSDGPGGEPDVVLACAGDVPTMEVLAAVGILGQHLPQLRVRVVNVVDLACCSKDCQRCVEGSGTSWPGRWSLPGRPSIASR